MSPVDREWLANLVELHAAGEDLSHVRASDLFPAIGELFVELATWKTIAGEMALELEGDAPTERVEMEGQMSIDEVTS